MKFGVFFNVVAQLRQYFEDLRALKVAGLDLIKLDAHNELYKMFLEYIMETTSHDTMIEIVKLADSNYPLTQEDLSIVHKRLFPNDPLYVEDAPKNTCATTNTNEYRVNGESVSKDEYEAARNRFIEELDRFWNEAFAR